MFISCSLLIYFIHDLFLRLQCKVFMTINNMAIIIPFLTLVKTWGLLTRLSADLLWLSLAISAILAFWTCCCILFIFLIFLESISHSTRSSLSCKALFKSCLCPIMKWWIFNSYSCTSLIDPRMFLYSLILNSSQCLRINASRSLQSKSPRPAAAA